jgi:hypothetical protein
MQKAMRQAQAAQYPIYFLMVTRVVGTWQSIDFTTATPEMGHRNLPAGGMGSLCARADVVASRGAFQAMKHDPTRLSGKP